MANFTKWKVTLIQAVSKQIQLLQSTASQIQPLQLFYLSDMVSRLLAHMTKCHRESFLQQQFTS